MPEAWEDEFRDNNLAKPTIRFTSSNAMNRHNDTSRIRQHDNMQQYNNGSGDEGDFEDEGLDENNTMQDKFEGGFDFEGRRSPWPRIPVTISILVLLFLPGFLIWRGLKRNNSRPSSNTIGGLIIQIKPMADPPTNIADICSYNNIRTPGGYQACEKTCEVSVCCNYPSSLDASCIFGNEAKCLRYHEHCVKLSFHKELQNNETVPISAVFVPESSMSLQAKCSHNAIVGRSSSASAYLDCKQECLPGQCCFSEFFAASCASNPACNSYAQCLVLDVLDSVHDEITNEVDRKCSLDHIRTINGRVECLNVCTHSFCCNADDIAGPCPSANIPNNPNNPIASNQTANNQTDYELYCEQYKSCSNVFNINKQQINIFCDPIVGDEDSCRQLCLPGRCCFDNQGECFNNITQEDCYIYQSCSYIFSTPITRVHNSNYISDNYNNQTQNNDLVVTEIAQRIEQKCTTERLHTVEGRTECSHLCLDASCCFQQDRVEGSICSSLTSEAEKESFCLQYKNCDNIFTVTESQVDAFCKTTSVDQNSDEDSSAIQEICRQLCSPARCCFDHNNFCSHDITSGDCYDIYSSCRDFYFSISNDADIDASAVTEKCSADKILTVQGRHECKSLCVASYCCHGSDAQPCLSDDYCLQYAACSNVFTVTVEQINTFCDPILGHEQTCFELCTPATCCFSSIDECYDGVTLDDCFMYEKCSNVLSIPGKDGSTFQPNNNMDDESNDSTPLIQYDEEEIRDACLNHNTVHLCSKVCRAGECCSNRNKDEVCPDYIDCSIYEVCNSASTALSKELSSACNPKIIQRDKSLCIKLCVKAACCYTVDPVRSCHEKNISIVCDDYAACDIIYYSRL